MFLGKKSQRLTIGAAVLVLVASIGTAAWLYGVNSSPPGAVPGNMVWIRGGEFWMGSDAPMFPDAQPVHRVTVHGFFIDKTEVTNEQFERFVKATGMKIASAGSNAIVSLQNGSPRLRTIPARHLRIL